MAAPKAIVALVALALCAALVSACGASGPGSALRRCPHGEPYEAESGSPGSEGDAVPRGAVAALVCRWNGHRLSEATVRGWPADRLARTMDDLPPSPELEGVYSCEEAGPGGYLIGFRYPDGTGEVMGVSFVCGWNATNRRTGKAYVATVGLRKELDRDLAEGR
jgi:hypothetical protein